MPGSKDCIYNVLTSDDQFKSPNLDINDGELKILAKNIIDNHLKKTKPHGRAYRNRCTRQELEAFKQARPEELLLRLGSSERPMTNSLAKIVTVKLAKMLPKASLRGIWSTVNEICLARNNFILSKTSSSMTTSNDKDCTTLLSHADKKRENKNEVLSKPLKDIEKEESEEDSSEDETEDQPESDGDCLSEHTDKKSQYATATKSPTDQKLEDVKGGFIGAIARIGARLLARGIKYAVRGATKVAPKMTKRAATAGMRSMQKSAAKTAARSSAKSTAQTASRAPTRAPTRAITNPSTSTNSSRTVATRTAAPKPSSMSTSNPATSVKPPTSTTPSNNALALKPSSSTGLSNTSSATAPAATPTSSGTSSTLKTIGKYAGKAAEKGLDTAANTAIPYALSEMQQDQNQNYLDQALERQKDDLQDQQPQQPAEPVSDPFKSFYAHQYQRGQGIKMLPQMSDSGRRKMERRDRQQRGGFSLKGIMGKVGKVVKKVAKIGKKHVLPAAKKYMPVVNEKIIPVIANKLKDQHPNIAKNITKVGKMAGHVNDAVQSVKQPKDLIGAAKTLWEKAGKPMPKFKMRGSGKCPSSGGKVRFAKGTRFDKDTRRSHKKRW